MIKWLNKLKKLKKRPELFQDIIYTISGTLIAAFALKSFLIPNKLLDGGVTGISLLLMELYKWPIALLIVVLNVPFIFAAAMQVNKTFAYKMLAGVLFLGLFLWLIPYPVITEDTLLVCIFGGFFLGLGTGLAMRGGCAIDGLEVLALYTLKRSSFTISEIILGLNVILFLIAAFKLGLEPVLYSMLTYFVASRTLNYVLEGLEEYTGVTIISGRNEEIKEHLVMKMGKGITVYKGERGYLKNDFNNHIPADIIFTVITRLEVRRLKVMVQSIDPNAFIFTHSIKEVAGKGGIVKQRKEH
jgi:uncharacterized membrane-anchored protein YitT (DUF2179 family)